MCRAVERAVEWLAPRRHAPSLTHPNLTRCGLPWRAPEPHLPLCETCYPTPATRGCYVEPVQPPLLDGARAVPCPA